MLCPGLGFPLDADFHNWRNNLLELLADLLTRALNTYDDLLIIIVFLLLLVALVVMWGAPFFLYRLWLHSRKAPVVPFGRQNAGMVSRCVCPRCGRAMQPGVYASQLTWTTKPLSSRRRGNWRWLKATWGSRKRPFWFNSWRCEACNLFFVDYSAIVAVNESSRQSGSVGKMREVGNG